MHFNNLNDKIEKNTLGVSKMIIKSGLIHDAVHEEAYIADIKIVDGKIAEIAENINSADCEVIDATGLNVFPGMVEGHCHTGLSSYGTSDDKEHNEKNDALNPHLRAIDGFNPFSPYVERALKAGITTICTGPGSAAVVGGTFMAVKTCGTCVDDMLVKNDVAMKCALGENPKRIINSINSRMSVAAKLREILFQTKEYLAKKELAGDDITKMPKFDMKLEAMIPVIKKEIHLKIHAHRADDICTAIRIAKEFDVKLTIEHCTEGHLIVDELVRANVPVICGPIMCGGAKFELSNKTFKTAVILADAGLNVSITTDAGVTQLEYLPICAGYAVKEGMNPFKALQAITINPARHIGVEDRVGSLEVGKDADILITDGDIMVSNTNVLKVIVDGKVLVEK